MATVPLGSTSVTKASVEHLVLDTAAIITGVRLEGVAEHYWTVEEVVREVRDARARQRLDTLMFDLKTRRPSDEAMAFVMEFARKTGDLRALSRTDLKVLALAYMLEKEAVGTDHLQVAPKVINLAKSPASAPLAVPPPAKPAAPTPRIPIASTSVAKPTFSYASAAKVASAPAALPTPTPAPPTAASPPAAAPPPAASSPPAAASPAVATSPPAAPVEAPAPSTPTATSPPAADTTPPPPPPASDTPAGGDAGDGEEWTTVATRKPKPARRHPRRTRAKGRKTTLPARVPDGPGTRGAMVSRVTEGDSDSEGEWITPKDLEAGGRGGAFAEFGSFVSAEKSGTRVGCVTTDYAMQNVLLQIGLNLFSIHGMVVNSLKQWVLKCDACGHITSQMDRIFCPACGNAALARLGVTLRKDGTPDFHYKRNRVVKKRGTKFPLPMPKGGRAPDLLLREDQLLTGHWGQRMKKKQAKSSMFDDGTAGDLLAPRQTVGADIVVGMGRKNPNAMKGRERRGAKKKNKNRR